MSKVAIAGIMLRQHRFLFTHISACKEVNISSPGHGPAGYIWLHWSALQSYLTPQLPLWIKPEDFLIGLSARMKFVYGWGDSTTSKQDLILLAGSQAFFYRVLNFVLQYMQALLRDIVRFVKKAEVANHSLSGATEWRSCLFCVPDTITQTVAYLKYVNET